MTALPAGGWGPVFFGAFGRLISARWFFLIGGEWFGHCKAPWEKENALTGWAGPGVGFLICLDDSMGGKFPGEGRGRETGLSGWE